MPTVNMLPASINTQNPTLIAFEYKQELIAAGNGDWIIIPDEIQNISVTAQASGGATARVETVTDPISDVANNIVTPVIWDAGEVTLAVSDTAFPCTAIRLVQTNAGSSKLTVRAQ